MKQRWNFFIEGQSFSEGKIDCEEEKVKERREQMKKIKEKD